MATDIIPSSTLIGIKVISSNTALTGHKATSKIKRLHHRSKGYIHGQKVIWRPKCFLRLF